METVRPKDFEGWDMSPIAQLFGSGPKLRITCGKCGLKFSQRIQMIDNPPTKCDYCGAVNIIPVKIER